MARHDGAPRPEGANFSIVDGDLVLTKNQVYVLVALLVVAALAFLVVGNYYVSIAAVVGMLVVGVIAVNRNRATPHDSSAR